MEEEEILKQLKVIEGKLDKIYEKLYGGTNTTRKKEAASKDASASHPPSSASPDYYPFVCDLCQEKKVTQGIKDFCEYAFKEGHKFYGKLLCLDCQNKKL